MKILGIETSCDETGVCIIEAEKDKTLQAGGQVTVLGNQLYSQVSKHQEFGGVFPMLAKREHAKNLVPLLEACLDEAGLLKSKDDYHLQIDAEEKNKKIREILSREGDLFVELKKLLETIEKPDIDAIAVTNGPGLEPALWVGVVFAKALNVAWNIPIIPTNHMEGHIVVSALQKVANSEYPVSGIQNTKYTIFDTLYPAIALLISGGHTQLVLIEGNLKYKIVGGTVDDAVGEAFDKVARMLGLSYPGGPQIAKYAEAWAERKVPVQTFKFPRPMIHSKDLNFSFSGLKTSVLYTIKEIPELTEEIKQEIAYEFKEAVMDVLVSKTQKAIMEYSAQTLIVGGGVIADKNIRLALEKLATEMNIKFQLPEISASTDNALMITVAGYMNILAGKEGTTDFKANGNLSL
jgi:N6-L-threonylcarbamoyladenine synthase